MSNQNPGGWVGLTQGLSNASGLLPVVWDYPEGWSGDMPSQFWSAMDDSPHWNQQSYNFGWKPGAYWTHNGF